MASANGEIRLESLLQRLEAAEETVDQYLIEKQDRTLIQALEHGSYGSEELDVLYEIIKHPLRATVVSFAASARSQRRYEVAANLGGDDPFLRGVLMLAEGASLKAGKPGVPEIDLLGPGPDDGALGRKGAAQVALIRRLIRHHGLKAIDAAIDRAAVASEEDAFRYQARTRGEVARLLSVVRPIEREHPIPMLWFSSPTGRLVQSTLYQGRQASPDYYMGVDK